MLYPSILPSIHYIEFLLCATLCVHDRVLHDQYFYFFQLFTSQEGYFRTLAALYFCSATNGSFVNGEKGKEVGKKNFKTG